MRSSLMLFLMAILIGAAGCTLATANSAGKKVVPYSLDTCPVSGQKLGAMGDPVVKVYNGREVKFCCAGCPAKFEKNLDANLKKLDTAKAACKCGAADCKCAAKAMAACSTECKTKSDGKPMACCPTAAATCQCKDQSKAKNTAHQH